jgi:hypothetical protein
MARLSWTKLAIMAALFGHPALAPACSLCSGNPQTTPTLRQDAAQARLILYGTMANPQLGAGGDGGTTDLNIVNVVKSDPFLGDKKKVELPRYVPVTDPKDPPKFLVFCDVTGNKLDPYRGVSVKSPAVVNYLKGALALDAKDRGRALEYYFRYLDDADPVVTNDAYLEFAKATDQEIGLVARKLSPDKFRRLIDDAATPPERLGLYAFLLGACGGDKDAALLRSLIQGGDARTRAALDGLLGGYIQVRPREGWDLALTILRDSKRSFIERYAVLRTLSFYYNWKPDDSRRQVLLGLGIALAQGDIADVAVEDLRRWKLWDLTADVLALFGKESHAAPIVQRGIVRYAVSCPRNEAARFVDDLRKQDPDLLKDVEESLQFEKDK